MCQGIAGIRISKPPKIAHQMLYSLKTLLVQKSEQSDNMIPDNVVHTCGFGAPATGYRSLTGLQAPVTLCTLSYKIEFLNSLQ